ncbi:AlpA family transcriptional regulator [Herminiimonas sp. CN]|uniref:helix-turn-helix transcriptional regulator n=1 Tax=Herminiimonas sp. CN TaxID=1349818 RepID=UPI001EE640F1|nr:AlpA family phage regulatory protein [Herminiimonas sp. CN]
MNMQIKRIYVDLPDVAVMVTLGETTIQRMVREDEFPKPRQLSGRRVAWLLREIEDWAENRPISDLLPPPNTGRRKEKINAARIQDAGQAA